MIETVDRYEISPGRELDWTLIWTCSCGVHRVNLAVARCFKCGDRSPYRLAMGLTKERDE